MNADQYLRLVGFELRDLPWRTKRDLLEEIREHLAELPEGTDLVERLGAPEDYVAELRAAAGLERRHGPVALLRRPRPRNLIAVILALILLGLAIGAVEWVDSYQPLVFGNGWMNPAGTKTPPTGDQYTVVRLGQRFRYSRST